ncbi:PP2C family protein-serine/threonine phosphatase [Kocuria turfanensis]|uniref:PP2C family protein-serine/threonine phosphatase n=1 Tax=Kocuria turfanensis TaxID=388357 RepID=UPI004035A652
MSEDCEDVDEGARVAALRALGVLDTPREDRYDRLVALTQRIFAVPMVAVAFVDTHRSWIKAEVGMGALQEGPRREMFCHCTVESDDTLVVSDAAADPDFAHLPVVVGAPEMRFYAGHPLRSAGGYPVGTLCVMDTVPRAFTDRDRELLVELAGVVERELVQQRDLEQAGRIQQMLMPRTTPEMAGYELAGAWEPAGVIGGDFFAWQTLQDGNLQVHVADVMGRGIPAALIAASLRAVLVGASRYNDQTQAITRAAAATQDLLQEAGSFVTAFSARLHPTTGRVEYIDAGHGLAFVNGPAGYRRLESSGPPLGVFPDSTWRTRTTVLDPGETLVVISDGYLEFFPSLEDALAQVIDAGLGQLPAQELVDRVAAFARTRGHADDVTVVALRRDTA